MSATPEFTPRFRRALRRKRRRDRRLAEAVEEAVRRILTDPENRGLNQHLLDNQERIWEAYVTKSQRIVYQRQRDTIIFRNNCRHDIIDRGQW